jgi:hypothetical protein
MKVMVRTLVTLKRRTTQPAKSRIERKWFPFNSGVLCPRLAQTSLLVCILSLLAACQSYTQESAKIRVSMQSSRFEEALKLLDQSSISSQKRNTALYLMERGMIQYLNEDYAAAAEDWRKASEHIEKLYTISISSAAASMAVNDSYGDYEGELHEKVLLPTLSALSWLAAGDITKARIEARRLDEILSLLEKDEPNKDKPKFARDAFAHYLSGLIYEAKREWDSALIEYNRGLKNVLGSNSWNSERVRPSLFADPLCRIAHLRGRKEIKEAAEKSASLGSVCTSLPAAAEPDQAEVVIFYENGRSPIKESQDIVLPIQGQVVRISFPVYRAQSYSSRGAAVILNGTQKGRTQIVEDIGFLARKALESRRAVDTIKMAARVLAKDQAARAAGRALGPLAGLAASVVGAVTETADTRGWTSLPDQIEVYRLAVPAGKEMEVTVRPDSGKLLRFVGTLKPGEIKVMRLRSFF